MNNKFREDAYSVIMVRQIVQHSFINKNAKINNKLQQILETGFKINIIINKPYYLLSNLDFIIICRLEKLTKYNIIKKKDFFLILKKTAPICTYLLVLFINKKAF